MEKSQSGFISVLLDKKYRWFWHLLFWITIYMDQFLSFFAITPEFERPIFVFLGLLLDMTIVYFNIYVLVPAFLLKEKIIKYILITFLSLTVIMIFNHYAYPVPEEFLDDPDYDPDFYLTELIVTVLSNAYMLGMAVAIKLFKYIYTDDGLPDAIMSLSDLLRYQIYETEKEYVSVENEIEYIKNYLDLENNRRDNLDINIKTKGVNKQIKIAPLLLLPLVENAVKYSQRTDGKRAIINLEVEIDDRISFTIINTKGKVSQIKSPDSGVGLNNLTKRLELIYPDDHQYVFKDTEETYTTSLILGKR